MKRAPILLVTLAVACARFVPAPDPAGSPTVGSATTIGDPVARDPVGVTARNFGDRLRDRPLATTIWYPAAAGTIEEKIWWDGIFPGSGAWEAPLRSGRRRRPLVLLSHGSGGDGANLAWLAEALASRGYIAAAVDHPGDRFGDSSVAGRFAAWRRPPDVSAALSHLLADPTFGPRIDPRRVAAAGHSSGGVTVLALAGMRLRPAAFLSYCHGSDAGPDCALVEGVDPAAISDLAVAGKSYRDARIRGVLALSPALGRAATSVSLRRIRRPVEIVASPTDELVPFHENAARYARLIPHARLVAIPDAGHFVFMPVCTEAGRLIVAQVCVDLTPQVDRAAIHARTAKLALEFFDRVLGVH